jgi:capsular polysaccharide export protein
LAAQVGISKEQIIYLESGDLNALLKHAKGTVLVNSTVGTSALAMGSPVIALGSAIYDMDGLTFQGSLDQFWTESNSPDKALFNNFQQAVIEQTQINGGFYNQKGIEMSVQGSLPKLLDTLS